MGKRRDLARVLGKNNNLEYASQMGVEGALDSVESSRSSRGQDSGAQQGKRHRSYYSPRPLCFYDNQGRQGLPHPKPHGPPRTHLPQLTSPPSRSGLAAHPQRYLAQARHGLDERPVYFDVGKNGKRFGEMARICQDENGRWPSHPGWRNEGWKDGEKADDVEDEVSEVGRGATKRNWAYDRQVNEHDTDSESDGALDYDDGDSEM
ncbi:uncharacterized protein EI97DRAFT_442227 [Westerdykella ornata]|uniref:Uncharacterized protein n=1 Tax=Westerdykella ornata TaxID=318751 RepID=A0A6A6JKS5_WESOR|nr:uncharacterized protein EI97DRAFT_442227 [Westerdykella ornata]KAF2276864.1 hypothetical protein EI97DRAFT_442227 [Westerdykella ornata]